MNESESTPQPAPVRADADRVPPGVAGRPIASEELLRGGKNVEISHNGALYRLQATRLGKLILTK